MLKLGEINTLTVLRETDFGFYLGDNFGNDVLLPKKWAPETLELDNELDVFIYRDHEERLIATTLKPWIYLHEFAYLKTKEISHLGAFMDWGMEKDLFIPFRNQPKEFEIDKWYCVYLYIDEETDRLVGTAKIDKHLDLETPNYERGDKVSALVCEDTDLGVKLILDNKFRGLAYHSDSFKDIRRGDWIDAYVKTVREDHKIDVSLEPVGAAKLEPISQKVFDYITDCGGQTHLTDKSAPEEIHKELEISKKAFKAALGILYKAGKVVLSKEKTTLK